MGDLHAYDLNRPVGFESRKAYARRCATGFWHRHVAGPVVLDIGYRGAILDAVPVLDGAIGVEQDFPGYDGFKLPFKNGSVDTVHASHVLEHLLQRNAYLQEWFRAIRVGGTIILMVPHAFLYERRLTVPPSKWSPEHLCSFTPATLLKLIETSLVPNSYRISHLADNDAGYDYTVPSHVHPVGGLEIECVIRKIQQPEWRIDP